MGDIQNIRFKTEQGFRKIQEGAHLERIVNRIFIAEIIWRRRWASLLTGVFVLIGFALPTSNDRLLAKDESVYQSLEEMVRQGKDPRGRTFDSLTPSEKGQLQDQWNRLHSPVQRRVSPTGPTLAPISPSPVNPTSNNKVQPIILLIVCSSAVLVAFFLLLPATGKGKRRSLGLLNRIAMFKCQDCQRPICLLGAQQASMLRLRRGDPQFHELDKTRLTEQQLNVPELVWIEVRCAHCDQELCLDEAGNPVPPPRFASEPSGA